MPDPATTHGLRDRDPDQQARSFVPDVIWALIGGAVLLAVCIALYTLIVTWGGWRVGLAAQGAQPISIGAYSHELAGIFLGGFLVVFIARAIGVRAPGTSDAA